LAVSVTNAGYVTQPVTLRVTLQPAHGSAQRQTMSTTLGPLQSYAFVANPAASGMTRSRTYQVTMSPSGNR
jgi:hypothetical protein